MEKPKKPSILPFFLIPIILLLNVEIVVPNIVLNFHLVKSYFQLAVLDMILGMTGLIFWYFFVGYFWKFIEHTKIVESSVSYFSKTYDQLKRIGVIKNFISWFEKMSIEDPKNREFVHYMGELGKVMRFVIMFIVPFNAVPIFSAITWFPAVIFCRMSKWSEGLVVMLVGDAIKNACMSYLWWQLYN